MEELVDAREEDSPENAECPCPDGGDRHGRVIGVGYGGSDFGVRGIVVWR
jgi:hypothetical protein